MISSKMKYAQLSTKSKIPDNGTKNLLTPRQVHQFVQVVF